MKIKWYKRILPPACLAIFLFRLLEVRMVTDSATGMVKVNSAAEILFNVVLALLALFFCSALFMKREPKPAAPRLYRENKSDAIFGIGGAVLTVTAGLFRFFSELTDGVFALDLKIFGQAAFWQLLLGVVSALFLIFYVTWPKVSAKQDLWRILSLSLTASYVTMMVDSFMNSDVVFSHLHGVFTVTFYGLAAAASVNLSKVLCRLTGRRGLLIFSNLSALVLSLRLADAVLYLLPGNPYGIEIALFSLGADVFITLLLLSQAYKLFKKVKRPEEA